MGGGKQVRTGIWENTMQVLVWMGGTWTKIKRAENVCHNCAIGVGEDFFSKSNNVRAAAHKDGVEATTPTQS